MCKRGSGAVSRAAMPTARLTGRWPKEMLLTCANESASNQDLIEIVAH